MSKWLKRLAFGATSLLGLACVPSVMADSVTYHTVLLFTSAGSGAALQGNSISGINANGKDQLALAADPTTYVLAQGQSSITAALDPSGGRLGAGFGSFSFSNSTFAGNISGRFELDVYQEATNPTSGSDAGNGVLVGKATATFNTNANQQTVGVSFDGAQLNTDTGMLELTLALPGTGNSGFPPTVYYTLQNQLIRNSTGGFELEGQVAEAPLPASASMGVALLGACGVAGVVAKRRRPAVTA